MSWLSYVATWYHIVRARASQIGWNAVRWGLFTVKKQVALCYCMSCHFHFVTWPFGLGRMVHQLVPCTFLPSWNSRWGRCHWSRSTRTTSATCHECQCWHVFDNSRQTTLSTRAWLSRASQALVEGVATGTAYSRRTVGRVKRV